MARLIYKQVTWLKPEKNYYQKKSETRKKEKSNVAA